MRRDKGGATGLKLGGETFDGLAEVEFAAARADVVAGGVVEIGERDGGHAHVAGGGRFHRFANDLRGGGDGDEIEFFAEGADQDGAPEAFDGMFGLTVLIEPLLERLSGVALRGERERD